MKYSLTYQGKNYSFNHPDKLDEEQALSIVQSNLGKTSPASILSEKEVESVKSDYAIDDTTMLQGGKGFAKGVGQFFTRSVPSSLAQLPIATGEEMKVGTTPYETTEEDSLGDRAWKMTKLLSDTISGKFLFRAISKPIAEYTHIDKLYTGLGTKVAAANDRFVRNHPEFFGADSKSERIGQTLGNAGASLISALGLTYLTGNPNAAAVFFGAMQKGSMYKEAIDSGLKHDAADSLSTIAGVGEGALEYIGLDFVTKKLRGSAPFRRWLLSSSSEFMQEASQQLSEETIAKVGWNRPGTIKDIAMRVLGSGAVGFLMGAPTAVVTNYMESSGELKKLRDLGFNDEEIEKLVDIAQATAEAKGGSLGSATQNLKAEVVADIDKNKVSKSEILDIVNKVEKRIVNKTISKYPQHITNQASLEEVGNAIAKEMGVQAPIQWIYKRLNSKGYSGTHYTYNEMHKNWYNKRGVGPGGHLVYIRIGSPGTYIHTKGRGVAGSAAKNQRTTTSQGIIKKLIVHELSHISAPPTRKTSGKREVHGTQFREDEAYWQDVALFDRNQTGEVEEESLKAGEGKIDPLKPEAPKDVVSKGLVEKARKYKSAEEFIADAHEIPISSIEDPKLRDVIIKKLGKIQSRTIDEPATVAFENGKLHLKDGTQRYYQKLDRGDKTIKIVFAPPNPGEVDTGIDFWNKANEVYKPDITQSIEQAKAGVEEEIITNESKKLESVKETVRNLDTNTLEELIEKRYKAGATQEELNTLETLYAERISEESPGFLNELEGDKTGYESEASLEELLSTMYHRLVSGQALKAGMDKAAVLANMRSNIKNFGGSVDTITDDQILAAAKDLYNARNELIMKYKVAETKEKKPTALTTLQDKLAKVLSLIEKQRKYTFLKKDVERKQVEKDIKALDLTPEDIAQLSDEERIVLFYAKMTTSKGSAHAKNIVKKYKPKDEVFNRYKKKMEDKYKSPEYTKEKMLNVDDKETKQFLNAFKGYKTIKSKQVAGKEIKIAEFRDIQLAAEKLENQTNLPFATILFPDVIDGSNLMFYSVDSVLEETTLGVSMKKLTPEGEARVANYIHSGTTDTTDMTDNEIKLGDNIIAAFTTSTIQSNYGNYEITIQEVVQYLKLKTMFDNKQDSIEALKESNIPPAVYIEAKEAYDAGGNRALEQFVIQGKFGFGLKQNYTPQEIEKEGVFNIKYYDTSSIYNPHIMPSKIEQSESKSTRPLMVKVHSYFTHVYGDYFLQDSLAILDGYLSKINLAESSKRALNGWYKLIKGQNIDIGAFGRGFRKARSAFFKTLFIDPYKWIRNLLQPLPFFAPKYRTGALARKLWKYKNSKMSKEDVLYFMKHVNQLKNLKRDWMYLEQLLFKSGPLKKIEDIATAISGMYAWTDYADRFISYGIALAGMKEDIAAYKDGKLGLRALAKRNGLDNLSDHELTRMFTRNVDVAPRFAARAIVEKSFWRYSKTQRGLATTTALGEFGGSLLTFPKGVVQDLIRNISNITGWGRAKGSPLSTAKQWNGLKNIVGVILLGEVANVLLQILGGEKEYYDPIRKKSVMYKPYGLKEMLLGLGFGGAQLSQLLRVKDILAIQAELITIGLNPNKTATDALRARALTRNLAKNVDSIAESHIPFLKKGMDLLESVLGVKRLHPLTAIVDKLHGTEPDITNELKRDFIDAARHALMGTERIGTSRVSPISLKSLSTRDKMNIARSDLTREELRELYREEVATGELAAKVRAYKKGIKEIEDEAKVAILNEEYLEAYKLYTKIGKTTKALEALKKR